MANDVHKMLQMVLDGQSVIRKDMKGLGERLGEKIDKNTQRIDRLGMQIANLEDDTPTIEEFEKLEKRVKKVEVKLASV